MLKRSFGILHKQLKQNDKTIKKTIQYIAQEQNLKSLFKGQNADAEQYVEDVVGLLNGTLPDVRKHQKTMDVHYSMLMNKLRGMVDREVVYATVDISKRIKACNDGTSLYNLIWEIQMDPVLREKATLKHFYGIITNPKFKRRNCLDLLDCVGLLRIFKNDVQIMALYKLNESSLISEYLDGLIDLYSVLNQFSQRLVLRILNREGRLDDLLKQKSSELHMLVNNHSQIIMIYQTLYHDAYKLPDHLLLAPELSVLQELFCETISLFSEYSLTNSRIARRCSQLVKSSLINKLSLHNSEVDHSININEYKFMKFLEDFLEESIQAYPEHQNLNAKAQWILEKLRKEYSSASELSLRLV